MHRYLKSWSLVKLHVQCELLVRVLALWAKARVLIHSPCAHFDCVGCCQSQRSARSFGRNVHKLFFSAFKIVLSDKQNSIDFCETVPALVLTLSLCTNSLGRSGLAHLRLRRAGEA